MTMHFALERAQIDPNPHLTEFFEQNVANATLDSVYTAAVA